jgi:hypothetical protein
MNKLVIYALICLMLVSSAIAVEKAVAEKKDFVELVENTPYCFDCHTIYKITKADDSPVVKLGVDFINAKGDFILPDFEVSYLRTENYIELVDVYEPCLKSMNVANNETGLEESVTYEAQCYAGSKEVQKTRNYYASDTDPTLSWDTIEDNYNNADVGSVFYVKVSGRLNLGEAVDNILVLNDFVYYEYAWWNSSFKIRMNISCINMTDGTPLVINGSKGFGLDCGGTIYNQIVWTICQGQATALYYNNCSSYVVANDTQQIPMEVEFGNGTGFNSTQAWTRSYFPDMTGYVFHYNQNNTYINSMGGTNGSNTGGSNSESFYIDGGANVTASHYINTSTDISTITSLEFTFMFVIKTTDTRETIILHSYDGVNKYIQFLLNSGGTDGLIDMQFVNDTGLRSYFTNANVNNGNSHFIVMTKNTNAGMTVYMDGIAQSVTNSSTLTPYTIGKEQTIGARNTGALDMNASFDEVRVINRAISASLVNETYRNFLGTPGYGTLGSVEENYIYIANESFGRAAILAGVVASEIGSSYSPYQDKQVYIRLANGSQYKGTFDKFIVVNSGSTYKRWAFNYDQNSSSGFPAFLNITPVFYVWQKYNMSYEQIKWNVSAIINNTYP